MSTLTMNASERADAILATKRKANIPHPDCPGMRIVGWVVPEELAGLSDALFALDKIVERTADKDQAYLERNHLVAALARLYPSGIRATNISGWSPDWHGCVYIDLPSGQISYHYHDSQAHLFADLPPYTKEWDGHDKESVHARLAAVLNIHQRSEGRADG